MAARTRQQSGLPTPRRFAYRNKPQAPCENCRVSSKKVDRSKLRIHAEGMRSLLVVLMVFLSNCCASPAAHNSPHQQLAEAFTLQREAQTDEAIARAQELLDAGVLDTADSGRAWILLGICYEDEGRFAEARRTYEHAIQILAAVPQARDDYAAALDDLGHLYRLMGQWQATTDLRQKAIRIYEESGNHKRLANAYINLSALDIDQKHGKDCKKHLKIAFEELDRSKDVDDDDRAAAYSIRAQLALFDHDTAQALEDDRRALELWKRDHGENHPLTGWGYMLVGRADSESGEPAQAAAEMQEGLSILHRTLGPSNPRCLQAEIAYANVLDGIGQHSEAAQLRTAASESLQMFNHGQCPGCTISSAALR